MTAASADPPAWPLRKWMVILAFIAILHVGLIVWVSGRAGPAPVPVAVRPAIYHKSDGMEDLPGLIDPTLFVLPGWRGFSGPAWLQSPSIEYHAEDKPEPAMMLTNKSEELGGALGQLVRDELSRPMAVAGKSAPRLDAVDYFVPVDLAPAQSVLRIDGSLASRSLVRPLTLEPQPSASILSNSIVEIVVDAAGRVFSPPTLLQGCGLAQADAKAVELAGSARFKPLARSEAGPGGGLTWGRLVFQWRTVPAASTNGPAAK